MGARPASAAEEGHGRQLTATPEAARLYRVAQDCHGNLPVLAATLRQAVVADPGFEVAAADLAALDGGPYRRQRPPHYSWERHHVEVVLSARCGDQRRTYDLLREHLAVVGCDPVALAVVVALAQEQAPDDLMDMLRGCHHPSR